MSFTYDPTTDTGFVRLRIGDKNSAELIFTDEEISAMLLFEGDKYRASAFALETIASNQVYVLKVIKLLQLSTDGAKVAAELRAQASAIRAQADFIDAGNGGLFDWAETIDDDFAARERIMKDIERDQSFSTS